MKIQEKISKLAQQTSVGLYEREEVIKLCFAALLAQESVFLLGKPGVGKSFVARRMKDALQSGKNFEYLMNRFSTPEEIFGPISLKKLDEDKYERVVEDYLPTSDIAFLDEIWKASPAIQNTLLTIINEKLFRNGSKDIEVPLKLLISASNELPAAGEGLEALYDRFLIRYYVENVQDLDSFNSLITSKGLDEYKPNPALSLSNEELEQARSEIKDIVVSNDILNFINRFRKALAVKMHEKAPYVSDRRWKKIVNLLKASAYASNRKDVSNSDLLLIPFTIWETESQQKQINEIFDTEWIDYVGRKTGESINALVSTISSIEKDFKAAYVITQQHSNIELSDDNGDIRKYYKFELASNQNYFWIPLVSFGEKVAEGTSNSSSSYVKVYYANKTVTTNPTSSENWYISDVKLDALNYRGYGLTKIMADVEVANVPVLEELKKKISKENIKLVSVKEKLEELFNEMIKEEHVLVENFETKIKLAKATMLDLLDSKIHELTNLNVEITIACKK